MQPARLVPLALVLCSAPLVAQNTWVVDDTGGIGVDFNQIQPAITAAADGDVILVRPGTYSNFYLNGKGLTVAADPTLLATVQGASVRNLTAAQSARLDGLVIQSPIQAGLQIKVNLGPVWIEDCQIVGADGDGTMASSSSHPDGHAGLQVVDSAQVSLARCEVRGGLGDHYIPLLISPGGGGDAIELSGSGSGLAVFDSVLQGGHAGDVYDDDAAWGGPKGGDCVQVSSGELLLVGNLLTSGSGGMGGEDFDLFGYSCGDGGDAGHCIHEPWPWAGLPVLHLAQNSFTSGQPGQPYPGASCSSGQPGSFLDTVSATVDAMSSDAYALQVTDPVREGETIAITVFGPPDAVVWLAYDSAPGWLHLPTLGGLALVDPLGFELLGLGVTGAGGFATASYPAPALVPAGQGLELYLQVVGYLPTTGQLSLGSPSGLLLLDASL